MATATAKMVEQYHAVLERAHSRGYEVVGCGTAKDGRRVWAVA